MLSGPSKWIKASQPIMELLLGFQILTPILLYIEWQCFSFKEKVLYKMNNLKVLEAARKDTMIRSTSLCYGIRNACLHGRSYRDGVWSWDERMDHVETSFSIFNWSKITSSCKLSPTVLTYIVNTGSQSDSYISYLWNVLKTDY